MRHSMMLMWLLASIVTTSAHAQQDDQLNAAYWYQRAIEQLQSMSHEQRDAIANYMPGEEPTPELRNALRNAEPVFSLMQRGAAQQYSDFGLDLSRGIELTLPHLAQLRQCTKLMVTQAQVRMLDGDTMGAARDLSSLYRLGEHMADDRIVISSLVGQAIFTFSDQAVQYGIDRGAFDAAAAAELAKAAQRFDAQDPFGYVETLFGEQELMISTLENHLAAPDVTNETIAMLVGHSPHAEAFFEELKQEGLDAQIGKIDATMNEVIEIFMIEDEEEAKQRIDEFEDKIEVGEFGSLAMLLIPAYGKIHERMLTARMQLAQRRAILEQLAAGELEPGAMLNAALLYQQAIDAWYAMEANKRAVILSIAAQPTQAFDEPGAALLVEAGPVIDLTRQASHLKRCDFEALRRHTALTLAPDYVIGMHELLTLLRVDALRLAREKSGADAADRLAIGYRAIGHMSGDSMPVSALAAHHAFDDLTIQLKAGLSAGLYDQQREVLCDAVDRISRRDPFGYVNAVMGTRKQVERELSGLMYAAGGSAVTPINDAVRDWQGDALMHMTVVIEMMREQKRQQRKIEGAAETGEPGEEIYQPLLIDRLAALTGLISIEAVAAAQKDVDELAARLPKGEVDIISGREIPSIGSWEQRMTRARSDLREARRLVMAEDAREESD